MNNINTFKYSGAIRFMPEMRTTASGGQFLPITVAQESSSVSVNLFDTLALAVMNGATIGSHIVVDGWMTSRKNQKTGYFETALNCQRLSLDEGRSWVTSEPRQQQAQQPMQQQQQQTQPVQQPQAQGFQQPLNGGQTQQQQMPQTQSQPGGQQQQQTQMPQTQPMPAQPQRNNFYDNQPSQAAVQAQSQLYSAPQAQQQPQQQPAVQGQDQTNDFDDIPLPF